MQLSASKINLHRVQTAALEAARGKRGFGFIMEQGLGKSLTSLAEMMELWAAGEINRAVVVCPNSFKSGWVDEIEKWGLDDRVTFHVFESGNKDNHRFVHYMFDNGVFPILIVNFEAIRSDTTQTAVLTFVGNHPAAIYCDESIQISTHNSNQTKSAVYLAKHFKYRRILSGKWMKQGPHDFWAQLRFLGALDGFNYFAFRSAFCKMGGFKGKAVVGAMNEERLAEIINPHIFEARKSEWTDLPPKMYTTREYKMTPVMQRHFDSMYEDFIAFVSDDQTVAVDVAITKYLKLAQIQAGFILDEQGVVHPLCTISENPRLNALIDMIEMEVTGKVIIPYHHRYSGEVLARALAGYNPARIAGGMQPQEISDEKRRFNTDPSCRAILLQTRASKYGHTLLGDQDYDDLACRTMVFYENTYSLDDRSQIEDRMHRHGQRQDSVLYIDLVGTRIDRDMTAALQRKESLYQAIMQVVREKRK